MGAIHRAGGRWPWLHSSNDAARKAVDSLAPISKASNLSASDLVFKHMKPGEKGYDLPKRYEKDSDHNDYIHVGVVLSVIPLRIRHMTSPSVKLDTKLGKWSHHGWCVLIRKGGEDSADSSGSPDPTDPRIPVPHNDFDQKGDMLPMNEPITVESANGLPVKLRSRPGTSCSLYWEIPSGTPGILLSAGEGGWSRIRAQDIRGLMISGWMKSEFVKKKSAQVQGSASGSDAAPSVPVAPAEVSTGPAPADDAGESPTAASAPSLSAAEAAALLTEAMELERHLDTIFLILGGRG